LNKVVFHPKAELEYLEAFDWYEKQLAGLGVRFEHAIDEKLKLIRDHPLHNAVKHQNFREVRLSTFPYLIVYKFYPLKRTIFISAVHHFKRNPKRKYRR
jgi:plasmid stabilization system protein ParE